MILVLGWTLGWVIQFYKEIKIWLPLIVINNRDLDLLLEFFFPKRNVLINMSEILWCKGCVCNCSTSNSDLIIAFFDNGNFNNSITLSNWIVEAFESNIWIWAFYLVCVNFFIDLSLSTLQFDKFISLSPWSTLSICKSFKKWIWLQLI